MSSVGFLHMNSYDDLPPAIRERLRCSPFNLCAACVVDGRDEGGYLRTIEYMEQMLRERGDDDD
jgi:hypothetical protein